MSIGSRPGCSILDSVTFSPVSYSVLWPSSKTPKGLRDYKGLQCSPLARCLLHCKWPRRQQKPQTPPLQKSWGSSRQSQASPRLGQCSRPSEALGRTESPVEVHRLAVPRTPRPSSVQPSAGGSSLSKVWPAPVLIFSLQSLLFRCLRTCNDLMLLISKWEKDSPCLASAAQQLPTGSSRPGSYLHNCRPGGKSLESAPCNFPALGLLQRIR